MKEVILTFDDGPHKIWTEKILDLLKSYNIKAYFFLMGINVVRYPNIVKRILYEGHHIGNHGWSHKRLKEYDEKTEKKEIIDYHHYFVKNFGIRFAFFRPAYGELNSRYHSGLKRLGYKVVHWDINSKDYTFSSRNLNKIINIFPKQPAVILLHDGVYKSLRKSRNHTIRLVKEFIQNRNIKIVSYPLA